MKQQNRAPRQGTVSSSHLTKHFSSSFDTTLDSTINFLQQSNITCSWSLTPNPGSLGCNKWESDHPTAYSLLLPAWPRTPDKPQAGNQQHEQQSEGNHCTFPTHRTTELFQLHREEAHLSSLHQWCPNTLSPVFIPRPSMLYKSVQLIPQKATQAFHSLAPWATTAHRIK